MSNATVSAPSFATLHPGISSLMISTSLRSMRQDSPSTTTVSVPFFSSSAIWSWEIAVTTSFTAFINLPNFLPITRKLHFTFFSSIWPSTKSMVLTLTSSSTSCCTASSRVRTKGSVTGMAMRCKGWRTMMRSFLRSESTSEVVCCANSIRASSSLSISCSSATGKRSRCTLSAVARAVPAVRSL